ncbi:hypothetical protein NEUTE1DRAFT_54310 [Neurospora tetrasperma FGSC 2508]|uniref:SET domain-containing protein n=1 Tax=Neurospora tetrasperma (strain FGSC 2508 / ATCC MYA-4615 / P0657) TaxID=510951 RepID=F8N2I5_NEUT8|nr:uncharacterized protein NEUTE1DRAFT_54310 [Neurospora tetrasperma FGSC 2508]EGO51657.1 hypothetical protein NEUTE1DRAFT_54310 [Neurospora tetrasperma FGSC 2508]EGZ78345.1 SET domain-containing protein [Neurospora tetrasperma FGSC 2509]
MPSTKTVNVSESTPGDSNGTTSPSQIIPSTDRASDLSRIDPAVSLSTSSTEDTPKDSAVATDTSPAMPPLDAENVPLPDDEYDEDMLEVTPPADHEATTPKSDNVELANHEPTDLNTTNGDQDDTHPENINALAISFISSSSAPTSPKTPKRQTESFSDNGDHHESTASSLSSTESCPKTPTKEGSSTYPFVVEDETKSLSLDNLDLTSPNWMENIANFLEKIEHLEPDTEEILEPSTMGFVEGEEYDGPTIALPDTTEYHPYSNNFQIRLSRYGGFGTFATRDLKMGEVILIEKPLLRTPRDSFYTEFLKLSEEDQAKFMQLYTPPGEYSSQDGSDCNHIRAILKANSFAINPYSNDIISVYNVTSRLNHACRSVANVLFDFDFQDPESITLTISKPVKAGSELFISYGGSPLSLYERYGFRCCCGGCEGVTDQDIAIMKKTKDIEKYLWSGGLGGSIP